MCSSFRQQAMILWTTLVYANAIIYQASKRQSSLIYDGMLVYLIL